MGVISVTNLNGGINAKSDPSAIAEDSLQDCVGFDLTTEGILQTAGGLAANDIPHLLPSGTIECMGVFYIGSTRYVLATTSAGLYANGTLVRAGFTGRFKGGSLINNIFLVNGTYAVRFDGTNCYQWGITGPTTVPTITAGAYLTNTIDLFEDITTWDANKVTCVVAAEGTIKKEGAQSMKMTVTASNIGYSWVPYTTDLTEFSTGAASDDKDYIRFWLYVTSLSNLDSLALYFDIGDGTFLTDTFSYTLVSPGLEQGLTTLGLGKTADVIVEDTVTTTSPGPNEHPELNNLLIYDISGNPITTQGSQQINTTVTRTVTKTVVDPILQDQILSFWSRSSLFELKSATWLDVKIPKSLFLRMGSDSSKGWNTISKVKIEVKATAAGSAIVYIDNLHLAGGSDLIGEYYFTYSYARTDASHNVLHESAPAISSQQILFAGPITFDRHPLTYAARPISTDPQVNAGLISGIGGSLSDFWIIAQINDNTTVTDTLYNIGEKYVQRVLHSQHNQPAPAGTDLIVHQNKIWMVGDSAYPRILRSSDILLDGTIAPEAWPPRNGYDLENNHGSLTNIGLVNKMPVVKGTSGEWAIQVLDPTDYLQVKAKQVSSLGLLGQDAIVAFETSHIYPSPGGFVESNGDSAQFIMPEVQPLIDAGMGSAVGINAGLVSYFSYTSALTGSRTAKIDLFRGKPRFSNINDVLIDWFALDEVTKVVYGLNNGAVYLVDSGSTDESTPGKEITALLKSRTYKPGNLTSWNRIEVIHNTGGTWFILHVYVDGALKASMPFRSTTRTTQNFRDFGPCSGYELQFYITGNYTVPGTIYFPIRIYHGR